jgi:hypothetical protein
MITENNYWTADANGDFHNFQEDELKTKKKLTLV